MRRIRLKFVIALALLVVSSAAGFVCRGWSGALIWPLLFCALIVVVGAALFVLRLVLSISFNMARLRGIRGRIGALSTEQLRELMQSPTHPDSQFALAELMRRGDAARPTKEQLFGMLTSGNPALCGHAMANLMVFYPELSLPAESSNLDSPELWRARVEELRRKGQLPLARWCSFGMARSWTESAHSCHLDLPGPCGYTAWGRNIQRCRLVLRLSRRPGRSLLPP